MNVYRWVWRAAWLIIGVVPVGLGFLEAPPIALFCLGTWVAVVVAATGQPISTWFASGLLSAAVVAGLWWAGAAGLGLLMLAIATAPFVVARVCGLRRRPSRESTKLRSEVCEVVAVPALTADLLAGPVHALEDEQLCLSWSESFVALKLTRTVDKRLELVILRQVYLDELESRHPTGFDSWLRSSAWPVGNPQSLFEALGSRHGTPPTPTDDQPIEGSQSNRVEQAGNGLDPPSDPIEQRTPEP